MSQLFALTILSIVNFCILILSNNALLKDLANDSFEKDKMMDKLKILAERDGLTGLFNRNAVEQYLDSAIHTKDTKVSISSGSTTCSGAESKRKILRRADLNLYTAKENGRSQTVGS